MFHALLKGGGRCSPEISSVAGALDESGAVRIPDARLTPARFLCVVCPRRPHPTFQFLISGMSWPCLSMYCLCSMSLSCIICFR